MGSAKPALESFGVILQSDSEPVTPIEVDPEPFVGGARLPPQSEGRDCPDPLGDLGNGIVVAAELDVVEAAIFRFAS